MVRNPGGLFCIPPYAGYFFQAKLCIEKYSEEQYCVYYKITNCADGQTTSRGLQRSACSACLVAWWILLVQSTLALIHRHTSIPGAPQTQTNTHSQAVTDNNNAAHAQCKNLIQQTKKSVFYNSLSHTACVHIQTHTHTHTNTQY